MSLYLYQGGTVSLRGKWSRVFNDIYHQNGKLPRPDTMVSIPNEDMQKIAIPEEVEILRGTLETEEINPF